MVGAVDEGHCTCAQTQTKVQKVSKMVYLAVYNGLNPRESVATGAEGVQK